MDLEGKKYSELQKIAKSVGIKANIKAEQLLKALKNYFEEKHEQDEPQEIARSGTPHKKSKRKRATSTSPKILFVAKRARRQMQKECNEGITASETVGKRNSWTKTNIETDPQTESSQAETDEQEKPEESCEEMEIEPEVTTPAAKFRGIESASSSRKNKRSRSSTYTKDEESVTVKSGGSQSRQKRKRGSTYDTEDCASLRTPTSGRRQTRSSYSSPNLGDSFITDADEAQFVADRAQGRTRKRTYSKSPQASNKKETADNDQQDEMKDKTSFGGSKSPGYKNLINSMQSGMSDEEMKASLLSALDQRVKDKGLTVTFPHEEASHIPRLDKNRFYGISTPGSSRFIETHQKEFDKMESIDAYFQRKHQRLENMNSNKKKLKGMSEKIKAAMARTKTPPAQSQKTKTSTVRKSAADSNKKDMKPSAFVPTVTSTKKASFQFIKIQKERKSREGSLSNDNKGSTGKAKSTNQKTWERLSSSNRKVALGQDQSTANTAADKKSTANTTVDRKSNGGSKGESKIPVHLKTGSQKLAKLDLNATTVGVTSERSTSYKFTGVKTPTKGLNSSILNVTTPSQRPKFDLKESLKRPITWKAYKGKLKPVNDYNPMRQDVKEVHTNARSNMRRDVNTSQAWRREDLLLKRRGLKR